MAKGKKNGQFGTQFQASPPDHNRLWAERFDDVYEAKREEARVRLEVRRDRDRRARARKAQREGHKPFVQPTCEEMARIILERDAHHERRREICERFDREQQQAWLAERKQAIAKRIREGFEWCGGRYGGETYDDGYWRPPFKVEGFRSDEHAIYRLFVQKVPRAAKGLKVGIRKSSVYGTKSKMLGLDMPVITFVEEMRGVWRVDIDGTFASVAAIYRALNAVGAPWPNIVTGFRDPENGEWVRPHFYYLLEDSVCFTDEGNPKLMRLFEAIARGLVYALLRLGADPGGLSNPNRGKNPLSPLWDSHIIRDEPWTMTELRHKVRTNVSPEHLARVAAEILEPMVVLKDGKRISSNSFFTHMQEFGCDIIGAHFRAGDYPQFHAEMQAHALGLCGDFAKVKEKTLRAVAQRVTDYLWTHHNPNAKPHGIRRGRGKCHHEVQGKTLKERRQIGGQSSSADRRAKSVAAFVDAYLRLVGQGRVIAGMLPKPGLWAGEAGLTTETLRVCRSETLAALSERLREPSASHTFEWQESQSRCIDKELVSTSSASQIAIRETNPAPLANTTAVSESDGINVVVVLADPSIMVAGSVLAAAAANANTMGVSSGAACPPFRVLAGARPEPPSFLRHGFVRRM